MKEILSHRLRDEILMHENTQEGWHHHMEEWMDFPNHMMGSSSVLGWLLTILFWALIIGGIILIVFLIVKSAEKPVSEQKKTPLETLNERYARGEIDDEEYEEKKKRLEGQ